MPNGLMNCSVVYIACVGVAVGRGQSEVCQVTCSKTKTKQCCINQTDADAPYGCTPAPPTTSKESAAMRSWCSRMMARW